jgi:hypothetical protein
MTDSDSFSEERLAWDEVLVDDGDAIEPTVGVE